MNRTSAITLVERKAWGGSSWDYKDYARTFNDARPYDFGVMTARLFSADPRTEIINKKFTYLTLAQGNFYKIPGGTSDYQWSLTASAHVEAYSTEALTAANAQNGKNGQTFKIALDKDWFHEPVLLKTESADMPLLRIIGQPKPRGANSYEYTVKIQDGNPAAYIPSSLLAPGKRFMDASTSVSDEMNTKFGGDQYSEMFKLQSHTGQYARKLEVSDKAIRAEIAHRKNGTAISDEKMAREIGEKGLGVGYTFTENMFNPKLNQVVKAGYFISMAETKLLNRIEMDRELMMEFGRVENTRDVDSEAQIKVAPGWRQLVQDGHYMQHNGTLTLNDIYEFLYSVFLTKNNFADRLIRISSGEAGLQLLNKLIAEQAKTFLTLDTMFIEKTQSEFHTNALAFGAQFTKWRAANGVIVELVYDPIKDNRIVFPQLAPGTSFTSESFTFDIYDFGKTDQKATGAERAENICMVMQDGVESYWRKIGVVDPDQGVVSDGSKIYSNDKGYGVYREMSGSLGIWDVTRIGRINFSTAY